MTLRKLHDTTLSQLLAADAVACAEHEGCRVNTGTYCHFGPADRCDEIAAIFGSLVERDDDLVPRLRRQVDEALAMCEWLAHHVVEARRLHTDPALCQDCPPNTACDGVDCYSEQCAPLIVQAAREAVRDE